MSADRDKRLAPPAGETPGAREDLELVLADDLPDEDGDTASEDSGVSFLDRFLPPSVRVGR